MHTPACIGADCSRAKPFDNRKQHLDLQKSRIVPVKPNMRNVRTKFSAAGSPSINDEKYAWADFDLVLLPHRGDVHKSHYANEDKEVYDKVALQNFLLQYPQYTELIMQAMSPVKPDSLNDIKPELVLQMRELVQNQKALSDSLDLGVFDEDPRLFRQILDQLITIRQDEERLEVLNVLKTTGVEKLGEYLRLIWNAGCAPKDWTKTSFSSEKLRTEDSNLYDIQSLLSVSYKQDNEGKFEIVLAFPGTKSLANLFIDFHVFLQDTKTAGFKNSYKVHSGFLKAFRSIRDTVKSRVVDYLNGMQGKVSKLTFAGHSLGGGMAHLFYMYIMEDLSEYVKDHQITPQLITFGAPPFCDASFRKASKKVQQDTNTFSAYFYFMDDIIAMPPLNIDNILNVIHPYGTRIQLSSLDYTDRNLHQYSTHHHLKSYAFGTFMALIDNISLDKKTIDFAHQILLELIKEDLVTDFSRGPLIFHLLRFGKAMFFEAPKTLIKDVYTLLTSKWLDMVKKFWSTLQRINPWSNGNFA